MVIAQEMALVAVHAALALLQINGIGGRVPVNDPVAVSVKVLNFLSDGGRDQDLRLEQRVECHAARSGNTWQE